MILLCLAVDVAIVGRHRLTHAIVLDSTSGSRPVLLSLSWLLPMNVLLLVFNMVPAFPLDGGRDRPVDRLAGDRRQAPRHARWRRGWARGSRWSWAGFGLWWLSRRRSFGGLWLLALAYLLWQSARGALVQSALAERIEGVRVADIMDTHPVAIPRKRRSPRRWTSTSCATASRGSRSSTTPGTCSGSPARSGPRPRSTAARRG